MLRRTKYICIEGVDGTGKTTATTRVAKQLKQELGLDVQLIAPTAHVPPEAGNSAAKIEAFFKRYPALGRKRALRQLLYAARSNHAASQIRRSADLVLGDRSVITSFVCHWSGSNTANRIWSLLINALENQIPAPDYAILLDAPLAVMQERLRLRGQLDIDDSIERARVMQETYHGIRDGRIKIPRIAHVQWRTVDANQTEADVSRDIFETIKEILL